VAIVVGIFLGCALFITTGFTLFADVKLWGIAREGFRARHEMPPQQRRRMYVMMATVYPLAAGYVVFLAIAPFGRRDTFIWFLIVPFLVVVPVGTIAAALRSYRLGQQTPREPSHAVPPGGERTPYKHGGSLGWVASVIDPDTSSWKPTSPPDGKHRHADQQEPE
jgi:hypothetical protein